MHFFLITLKNSLVYRSAAVFQILGSVLLIAINIFLWRRLFEGDPQQIAYMTRYAILANIIALFFATDIAYNIGTKVATGDLAVDLIKPVHIFAMEWQRSLGNMASKFLLTGLPVILVYIHFLGGSYHHILLALLAVVLAHVLQILIYSLLGFLAFVLIEIWPFGRFLDDSIRLFSGAFIPLSLLPYPIDAIARALPFRFLYSFPLMLLFGDIQVAEIGSNFALMLLWIGIFAALNLLTFRSAVRRLALQGG